MYVVGSELIAVEDECTVPAGRRHAVDLDGRVLCTAARPRFTWPERRWQADDDASTCALCMHEVRAREVIATPPAYPADAAYEIAPPREARDPIWW